MASVTNTKGFSRYPATVMATVVMLLLMMMMTSYPASVEASAEEYVVETVVMVDEVGVKKWEKVTGKVAKDDLETEMQSVLYEVNEIYKSLDAKDGGIKIRFQLKELAFPKGNFLSASLSHEVESNYAAEAFATFLDLYRPTKFDVAILFTGNQLFLGSFIRAKGFGKVGQLCTKKSLGVIKLTATFDDVLTTAHEMAHVFDAKHDDGTNCPSAGYIMTNWKEFLTAKRYQFSTCSRTSIANKLKDLGDDNCLVKTDKVHVLKAPRYGTLMSADDLCKRKFNSLAYVSRKNYSSAGYGDNVCLKLACRENSFHQGKKEWRTTYIPSPDGLYCGQNKQCLQGRCLTSSTGKATVSDSCPFGDQPVIEGEFPRACGQVAAEDCPKFKDVCCHTCDESNPELSRTADDECRKLEGAHSQMLRSHYTPTSYSQTMCSQLSCLKDPNFVHGKFNHKTYPTPDGMACGKNKRCRGGKCVVTPDGNPSIQDACPFGDQPFLTGRYNETCDDIVWRSGCKTGWEKICCQSCHVKL